MKGKKLRKFAKSVIDDSKYKKEIKSYFENLKHSQIGLKNKIKVKSVSKLGVGSVNANFLVVANGMKFVFRLNMELNMPKKSKREFEALKIVEKTGIAPKVRLLDDSKKKFDSDLLVLDYIEGKTSDKIKGYLGDKMIKNIARLCAKLHSIKITGRLKKLEKSEVYGGYSDSLKWLKSHYIDYINKKIKNEELLRIIYESYKKLLSETPKTEYEVDKVLTQGDFCEQNVIINKNEYRLIDFEDLGIGDASSEIALIFVTFGTPFNEKQRKLFLKEYFKIKKIKNKKEFIEKINNWISIKQFNIFLWSIKHILKIKHKEMHKHFIKKNKLEGDMKYVGIIFRRCLRQNIIDKKNEKFDIIKIFNEI
tara:strand:- start:233 stop:1327 length:1095 start_codon:yes stop_codon:yes gene_type:complete